MKVNKERIRKSVEFKLQFEKEIIGIGVQQAQKDEDYKEQVEEKDLLLQQLKKEELVEKEKWMEQFKNQLILDKEQEYQEKLLKEKKAIES